MADEDRVTRISELERPAIADSLDATGNEVVFIHSDGVETGVLLHDRCCRSRTR